MIELQGVFTKIYAEGGKRWKGIESKSGRGSDLATTKRVLEMLPVLLEGLHITSMLDAGCGDWNWMSRIQFPKRMQYLGVDIVPGLIVENCQKYPDQHFRCMDLAGDQLDACEFILCRSVLFHLSFANVKRVLDNFKSTGARWLLTTTYPFYHEVGKDIPDGSFHRLNLEATPFTWPMPHLLIPEGNELDGWLGLWNLKDLP